MSRYQKAPEKATFSPLILTAVATLLVALFSPHVLWGAPARQGALTVPPQLLLAPLEATTIELQTHTVELNVIAGPGGQNDLLLSVDALYRLRNTGKEPVNLLLRISPDREASTGTAPAPTLVGDGQIIPLQPAENGGSTGQITIPADSRVDVRLTYDAPLDSRLPLIRYDAGALSDWPGKTSMSIAISLPAYIPPESWLRLEPEGWRYQTGQENGIRWLYDQQFPDRPITLQFVHPTLWSELSAAQQAVAADGSIANSLRLGSLFHDLYDRAVSSRSAADRFFAQALAAYAAGVENGRARSASPAELAPLHAQIAALYRTRIVDSRGEVDPDYAELMVQSARAAVEGLAQGDAKATEMQRWQAEGLGILLDAANNRRDWQTALALVTQLYALPPDVVDPDRLDEAARALRAQQALQLLAEGEREAAIALAGPEIVDATLTPPTHDQSLFAGWQVTVTAGFDGTELVFLARPAPERADEAAQALNELMTQWDASRAARRADVKVEQIALGGGKSGLRLAISLPVNGEGEAKALAALVGPAPQWAFLQNVLAQSAVETGQTGRLIWREATVRQTLDLRAAGDQWDAMAANLEREATLLEQTDANADPERALRARIQAIHYRNAARVWEQMAGNSWAVTTLTIPAGVRTLSRSWLTTPTSPPQVLEFSAQTISGTRLLLGVIIVVLGLLLLTALLWWLL